MPIVGIIPRQNQLEKIEKCIAFQQRKAEYHAFFSYLGIKTHRFDEKWPPTLPWRLGTMAIYIFEYLRVILSDCQTETIG